MSEVDVLKRVKKAWSVVSYVGSLLFIVVVLTLVVSGLGLYSKYFQVLLFGDYGEKVSYLEKRYKDLQYTFATENQKLKAIRETSSIPVKELRRIARIRANAVLQLRLLKTAIEDAKFAVYDLKDPGAAESKLNAAFHQLRKTEAAVNAFKDAVEELAAKYYVSPSPGG